MYQTKHGLISIADDPMMENRLKETGEFMYEDVEACLPFLKGTVIDVGAHVGLWTIPASTRARVHAFEPNPKTLQHLRKNVEANKATDNVIIHDVLLGDPGKMYHEGGAQASGSNYYREGGDLKAKTLDDIVTDPVTFIKIDVEGMEPEVLDGAQRILAEDHPYLFIEINPKTLKKLGKTPHDIEKRLHGYTLYRYDNGWRHIPYLMPSFYNLLAVPHGKIAPRATPFPIYVLLKLSEKISRTLRGSK